MNALKESPRLTLISTRLFDILFSLIGLSLLFPILLIVMVILRFSGEREVFYRQVRIGRGECKFHLLKFATMLQDSPDTGSGELTLPNDPRVLPFGQILRKTKLNELPQLWNILVGDLSFIGPRPQTPRYYNCFREEDRLWIAKVRPGLSGVGSILFRDEEKLLSHIDNPVAFDDHVITPYKGVVEHWYVLHQSISLYLELIFTTLMVVLIPAADFQQRLLRRIPAPPPVLSKLLEN
jgi:lipopolysaccharide/colanic/teichoic acid biosynthesis glycosyltransferase